MKKLQKIVITTCLSALTVMAFAQEKRFFMPLEIQKAYAQGTRSYDGKPGKNYWQNTADYAISVNITPETRMIDGTEKVIYYNNSPNELKTLVVRLYYDVFKKGAARATNVNPKDISDGVALKSLKINDTVYDLKDATELRRSNTNLSIQLREPLKVGGKLTLDVDWSQQILLTNDRTGAADSSSFFVAYFYPQIAVYDDVFGWDNLPFTMQSEFYNNLANFDVTIKAPKQFTVWATGELQNPQTVYPPAVYQRSQQAKTATETVHVLTDADLKNNYQNLTDTWHYIAREVSDFAFGMSDHYLWDAASQKVENRNVLISTVFPINRAEEFGEVTALQQKTMQHFSQDFPGVPYPYPAFTDFIGLVGGGMEFPMMCYNDGPGRLVTVHEMFHTYFPMYVRINEKRFAWMDEGWAEFSTDFVASHYFDQKPQPVIGDFKFGLGSTGGSIQDLPLITSTQFMDATNYGYASYPLPAFFYATLQQYLGDELFAKCVREYIQRWAKKSPTPYDFFYTFENVSGQDLAWLWKPWFFEFGYADVAIASFNNGKLRVENRGSKPVPLQVVVNYKNETKKELYETAAIWKNANVKEINIPNAKEVKILTVNTALPDATDLNNFYPSITSFYEQYKIAMDIEGTYKIKEYPVTMTLSRKEGALYVEIAGGMGNFLIPESASTFSSLDGNLKLEFTSEQNKITGAKIQLLTYGLNLTALKN